MRSARSEAFLRAAAVASGVSMPPSPLGFPNPGTPLGPPPPGTPPFPPVLMQPMTPTGAESPEPVYYGEDYDEDMEGDELMTEVGSIEERSAVKLGLIELGDVIPSGDWTVERADMSKHFKHFVMSIDAGRLRHKEDIDSVVAPQVLFINMKGHYEDYEMVKDNVRVACEHQVSQGKHFVVKAEQERREQGAAELEG